MSINRTESRGPVYFSYAAPDGFSGQREATEIVLRGLAARGWDCRRLPLPVLDRGNGGESGVLKFGLRLLVAWGRSLQMLGARGGSLCVNLGQTRFAFLRDAVPLLVGRLRFGRARLVVSLHGSLFMTWADGCWNARLLAWLLRHAATITVLGERQRLRLLALGLETVRVEIVLNSCALTPLSVAQLHAKQVLRPGRDRPLRLLHLSSLIATKGFPEYLAALEILARRGSPVIEAVLCGRVNLSEFQQQFSDQAAAEAWIEAQLAIINQSQHVRVRWVRGAIGVEKAQLFREADVFILPTRYAVEAQPLVLLEAMASGCAIITTSVGEIPTILDETSAILLAEGTAEELGAAIARLAAEQERIGRLALAAHRRFLAKHENASHLDGWEARLGSVRAAPEPAGMPATSQS